MIRELLTRGEVAVIGLGRSGRAASELLRLAGARVYASDASSSAGARQAAALLNESGVDAAAGAHDLERISTASVVVASPGVSPDAAPLACARARGVPIVSEVEVALAFLPGTRVVAVTGTNGKSTVTALVDHLLRALGRDAVAAGNIGTALSEVAVRERAPAWVALEMSSFQLHDTPSLSPAVGVLLNLAPDHLDRYAAVEDYYADKLRLFANARADSVWVTNADDAEVRRRTAGVRGTHVHFSLADGAAEAGPVAGGGRYHVFDHELSRVDIPLLGDHNVANALAAALAVAAADGSHRTDESWRRLDTGLRSFRGLPHRLELVADAGGVQWIDDSKATNVSAARVAIDGMTRPVVVLLGGRHKGEPYTTLADALRRHAKRVIAYGEAAPIIEHDLRGVVPLERLGSSFVDVMTRARAAAGPGDAVLLSPACSSFDMFTNYEERGADFRRLASGR